MARTVGRGIRINKDKMKNRINIAHLEDTILQQEFEIICKKNTELSSQLTKAKEIIKELLSCLPKENIEGIYEVNEMAEEFLRLDVRITDK